MYLPLLKPPRDEHISGQLLEIINDILDFSKIEAGQLQLSIEPYSLQQMLSNLETLFNYQSNKNHVVVSLDVDESIPSIVEGDSFRLRQVLVNLIGNAVKFSPLGGTVLLHVGPDFTTPDDPDRIIFMVVDSGIGIPEDKQKLIFGAFQQADNDSAKRFGGTGLGLAISSQLVEMMGGSLALQSCPDVGSVFYFGLPLKASDATLEEQDLAEPLKVEKASNLNILVAEDNLINQKLIRSLLEKLGHTVLLASDGADAVEIFKKSPQIDIVCMDIQMPNVDGVEATQQIRQTPRGKTIPIIALTAHAMVGDREKYTALGMNDYVTKPIDRKTLAETINRLASEYAKKD